MFAVVLLGKRSPLAIRYEEQIVNKYASWAQEISEKELYLRDYVRELEQQGIVVPEWKETESPLGNIEKSDEDGTD